MQAVNKQKFVGRFSLSAEWPLQRCNSSFCPNSCFFSKTCDCQPPNDCFSQKHAIVNPRTGRRNDVTAHIAPRIDCCNDVTAHIDLRIACRKAQQLILTSESLVARRNSSYCPPNRLLQGATGVYSKHATRATAFLHCLLHF